MARGFLPRRCRLADARTAVSSFRGDEPRPAVRLRLVRDTGYLKRHLGAFSQRSVQLSLVELGSSSIGTAVMQEPPVTDGGGDVSVSGPRRGGSATAVVRPERAVGQPAQPLDASARTSCRLLRCRRRRFERRCGVVAAVVGRLRLRPSTQAGRSVACGVGSPEVIPSAGGAVFVSVSLKPRMPSPSERAADGSRFGPRKRSAITRTSASSIGPTLGMSHLERV